MTEIAAWTALTTKLRQTGFQADDDKFTNPTKRNAFFDIETELRGLDAQGWAYLKAEALPRLSAKDPIRYWQPLFDTLNEAKAYNYLVSIKCTDVKLIPRSIKSRRRTPDLEGLLDGARVLCEVKTVNISDVEALRRLNGGVGTTLPELEVGIFKKVMSDLEIAAAQMLEFDAHAKHRFVYLIFNFDDSLHECADRYRSQIEQHLKNARKPDVQVVMDIRSPFFPDLFQKVV
jgi:hypothetical protein